MLSRKNKGCPHKNSIKIDPCGDGDDEDGELLSMEKCEYHVILMREGYGDSKEFAFCERFTLASPSVCVSLSCMTCFSTCPQEHAEDVEASDDNEEAEEEEGRSNGFHPSMRTPLAVISHG